ncbi:MAG: hypothetical protein GY847_15885 [Proteobacteria bacterium]|nr:hypothetical protein [Pseudomonadota bacterium]
MDALNLKEIDGTFRNTDNIEETVHLASTKIADEISQELNDEDKAKVRLLLGQFEKYWISFCQEATTDNDLDITCSNIMNNVCDHFKFMIGIERDNSITSLLYILLLDRRATDIRNRCKELAVNTIEEKIDKEEASAMADELLDELIELRKLIGNERKQIANEVDISNLIDARLDCEYSKKPNPCGRISQDLYVYIVNRDKNSTKKYQIIKEGCKPFFLRPH